MRALYASSGCSAIKIPQKNLVIFDGRNLFEPSSVVEKGIEYDGICREMPGRET